jgi:hypothetical protein
MVLVRVLEGEEDSAAPGGGGGTLYRRTLEKVGFN